MCCYHHLHHLCCEVNEYPLVPLQMIYPPGLSYVQWSLAAVVVMCYLVCAEEDCELL